MVHLNLVVPGDEEETLSKFSILMEREDNGLDVGRRTPNPLSRPRSRRRKESENLPAESVSSGIGCTRFKVLITRK